MAKHSSGSGYVPSSPAPSASSAAQSFSADTASHSRPHVDTPIRGYDALGASRGQDTPTRGVDTPIRRGHSNTPSARSSHPSSPGPGFRQVKLHATAGKANCAVEVSLRHRIGRAKPTLPHTPRGSHREPPRIAAQPVDHEDRDLSPMTVTSAPGGSTAATESTSAASESFSGTKILLKASEMIHGEVKSCESRFASMLQQEREAREFTCGQLRRDVEAMVTIVEALSAQVPKVPICLDPRLDAFLEQEKRARDALREDVEGLADQVSSLEVERQKDPRGISLEQVNCMVEDALEGLSTNIPAQHPAGISLQQVNRIVEEALTTFTEKEQQARDFSTAVLRKDFKKELEALVSHLPKTSPPLGEANINKILEQQRNALDATCADLRKDMKAFSLLAGARLAAPDMSTKGTGGTGNAEDGGCSLVSLTDGQHIFTHRLEANKKDIGQVETLTEQLRLDLASSAQVVHVRLEKVDQAINELQFDMRAAQALQRCLVDQLSTQK